MWVVIQMDPKVPEWVRGVYGPFRSYGAARDYAEAIPASGGETFPEKVAAPVEFKTPEPSGFHVLHEREGEAQD